MKTKAILQLINSLNGFRAKDLFKPGLTDNEIRNQLTHFGFKPISSLMDFFSTVNGTIIKTGIPIGSYYFFPGYYPLSLSEAVEISQKNNLQINKKLLPLFSDGGGGYIVVDKEGTIYFLIEGTLSPSAFKDLSSFFEIYKKMLDEGVVFINSNGFLDMDDVKFIKAAHSAFPESEHWKNMLSYIK